MNEQLDRAGVFQVSATNDTSGNFNNGRLVGAKFPLEFNQRDENVGRHGQGIYFPANAYMDVERRGGWSSLKDGVTVDLFVMVQQSTTARSTLFSLAAGVELYLNGLTLGGRIEDDTAQVLLSKQRTTSCATCHDPAKTFTDLGHALSTGIWRGTDGAEPHRRVGQLPGYAVLSSNALRRFQGRQPERAQRGRAARALTLRG